MEKQVIGRAGRFTVYADGAFSGPVDYIAQVNLDTVMASVKLYVNVSDAPVGQLVAVALQTDYAAYLGRKDMQRWAGRA